MLGGSHVDAHLLERVAMLEKLKAEDVEKADVRGAAAALTTVERCVHALHDPSEDQPVHLLGLQYALQIKQKLNNKDTF